MIKDTRYCQRLCLLLFLLVLPTWRMAAQTDSLTFTDDELIEKLILESQRAIRANMDTTKMTRFQKRLFLGDSLKVSKLQRKLMRKGLEHLSDSSKQAMFNTDFTSVYNEALHSKIPKRVWYSDLYLYGSWEGYKNGNLYTAINNIGAAKSDCYITNADIGISLDVYQRKGWFLEGNAGYSRLTLDNTKSLFGAPITSHMLTLDANVGTSYFELYGIGVRSNFRLFTSHNNQQGNTFVGFYDDCFNDITVMPYFMMRLRFQYCKFSARVGYQWEPFLNANRIAYHNMHNTFVDRFFYELQFAIRLFTTSNPNRHVNSLFSW